MAPKSSDKQSSVASELLTETRTPFQSPPALALRQFVRRNLLVGITTVIFIGVAVLLLTQIDRLYYNKDKHDLLDELNAILKLKIEKEELLIAPSNVSYGELLKRYRCTYCNHTEKEIFHVAKLKEAK